MQIPYHKLITLCKQIYHVVPQTTTSSPVSSDIWGLSQKALDVLAGLLAVYVIKAKWSQTKNKDTQTMKLVRAVQERDQAITRLETEVAGWKIQHKNLTSNRRLH